jgi:putative ABC transport system permease protein
MLQHVPFITRNALRNRRRSILTIGSIAVSLCLLGMLLALYRGMFYAEDTSPAAARRLIVHHKVSLTQSMPSSYKARLQQHDHVVAASAWQWFGGTYKDSRDSRNFFARFGVDPKDLFQVQPDLIIAPEDQKAFETQRTGAIASHELAEKLGWKKGERIDIVGDIFPVTLELTLVGTFSQPGNDGALFFNDQYLEESLSPTAGQRDWTGAFTILADKPENVPGLAKSIDAMFDNSPSPTKTESEKDFALSFLAFLGNLKMFLAAISGAVIFTMLLVSANTVAMTVRERTRETAILRTLGFAPPEILGFILGEAAILGLVGGVIGALLATGACFALHNTPVRLPLLAAPWASLVAAAAIVIAVISAVLPAYFASRRPVVESLRFAG